MSDNQLLHATAVVIGQYGVLLTGKSGNGKSDLALRLIENKNAVLVADDVVRVVKSGGKIYAQAVENIAGLLEVRGVGLIKYPHAETAEINLCVRLVENAADIERLPEKRTGDILGLEIAQIDLYAKENSAPEKVMAAIRCLKDNQN